MPGRVCAAVMGVIFCGQKKAMPPRPPAPTHARAGARRSSAGAADRRARAAARRDEGRGARWGFVKRPVHLRLLLLGARKWLAFRPPSPPSPFPQSLRPRRALLHSARPAQIRRGPGGARRARRTDPPRARGYGRARGASFACGKDDRSSGLSRMPWQPEGAGLTEAPRRPKPPRHTEAPRPLSNCRGVKRGGQKGGQKERSKGTFKRKGAVKRGGQKVKRSGQKERSKGAFKRSVRQYWKSSVG